MNLASYIDHTNLKPDAKVEDIEKLCQEAVEWGFATVAINSCWTSFCAEKLKGTGVGVTTCIGFPLGACSTETKVAETIVAVADNTDEIDMVINIGKLKEGNYDYVAQDIASVVKAAKGRPVKVILECCLLTQEEIRIACEICINAGASFVKTSTGFSTSGATVEDVELMSKTVEGHCKVKAAGGIHSRQEALDMISAGASRIGASCGIQIVSEN